jgi:hypothetical protein
MNHQEPCPGYCGICAQCIALLPPGLLLLMGSTKHQDPVLFGTAVTCAGMWLRIRCPVGGLVSVAV